MTIDDLTRCYSRILSDCEVRLPDHENDDFSRGYCYGEIEILKCVLRDLNELKGV